MLAKESMTRGPQAAYRLSKQTMKNWILSLQVMNVLHIYTSPCVAYNPVISIGVPSVNSKLGSQEEHPACKN